jgi:hypothetical protein
MLRRVFLGLLCCCLLVPEFSSSQLIDRISSDHVVMRMPQGRESLARDTISEIERCYSFMARATGAGMPRKIMINVLWDQADTACNWQDGSITVGLNRPEKAVNLNALLLHKVGREIARMGLLELSQGAQREDTEFLFEGMIELLVHEFDRSSRSLEAAWAYAQILDEMNMLGINVQRSWSAFSGGERNHRNAAPGITFFSTYRELQGRERPIKFFETLRGASLTSSLATAFKSPVAEVEKAWLKKVREHPVADEIILVDEDAPQLLRAESHPEVARPESDLQIRLFMRDRNLDLLPDGIYVKDLRTRRIFQALAASEKDINYFFVTIPIEAGCPPGQYNVQITAVDEGGNLRRWTNSYRVASR